MAKWLFLFVFLSPCCWAEMVVVINADSPVNQLSRQEVADIFLGRTPFLPNMERVIPIESLENSEAYRDFHANVTRKNLTQLNAYWARMVFAGRAAPPQEMNAQQAKKLIESSRIYIAYVDRSLLSSKMKVVFEY